MKDCSRNQHVLLAVVTIGPVRGLWLTDGDVAFGHNSVSVFRFFNTTLLCARSCDSCAGGLPPALVPPLWDEGRGEAAP